MTDSQDSGHDDEAQTSDDRVILITSTAEEARIIRDYLGEVPWLEVRIKADKRAA